MAANRTQRGAHGVIAALRDPRNHLTSNVSGMGVAPRLTMRFHHAIVALLLASAGCEDERDVSNPRSGERDGTGQTGMVSVSAGPAASVAGKVKLPPTAAIQPVDLGEPLARPNESQQALDDRWMSNALDARARAVRDEAPAGPGDRIEDDPDEENAENRGDGRPARTAVAPHIDSDQRTASERGERAPSATGQR